MLSVGATPDSSGIDAGGRWGCLLVAAGSAPAAGRARAGPIDLARALQRCASEFKIQKFKNKNHQPPSPLGAHHAAPVDDGVGYDEPASPPESPPHDRGGDRGG